MIIQGREILLIDDDANDIELAMLAFEQCQVAHLVHVVTDGEDALRCLQGWSAVSELAGHFPRLVILDLKMPKTDGLEILQMIRNSPRIKHVPVVVLTSSRMPSDLKKAYQLGCNAYVVKPVDHQSYTRTIEMLINFWTEINLVPQD
jgi:CheY-like chemotaxis protein